MTIETLTVTQDFTTIDLLLWRRFKTEFPGLVEDTIDRNRELCEAGPFLPLGTRVAVKVPDPNPRQTVRVTRLWS